MTYPANVNKRSHSSANTRKIKAASKPSKAAVNRASAAQQAAWPATWPSKWESSSSAAPPLTLLHFGTLPRSREKSWVAPTGSIDSGLSSPASNTTASEESSVLDDESVESKESLSGWSGSDLQAWLDRLRHEMHIRNSLDKAYSH